MRNFARAFLVAFVLLACVGCDQATKAAAREHLAGRQSLSYLHDIFRLTYAENPGAFLGVGARLPGAARAAIFQGAIALVVIAMLAAAVAWPRLRKIHVVAFALMASSGLGNLADRVLHAGLVTDFLNLGIGPLRTGIFNVADICGVVAVALLLIHPGTRRSPGNAI